MAKREANKRKRKAADDAPEGGPSGDGDSGLRSIDQDKNYMMRLPSELLIEILSYIVRQGDTIEMRDGKPTPERRNWNAEAKKLKDPTWKKPKPSLMPRNFAVCKELYRCGVKAFWGGNTFSFTTPGDLQQFIDVATTRARERVKSIALFRDYAISLAQSLAPPGIPAPGPWPQWPPSQVLLSALPNLQTLDICTTSINQRKALPTVLDNLYDSESQDNPAHIKSLTMRYDTMIARPTLHTRPDDPIVSQAFNVLAYTRDLQNDRFEIMPYPNSRFDRDPEHFHINRLWLEGRAAVHFDPTIQPAQNP